jgi:uncharacterized protein YgiM (DUF1202 family)
MVIHANRALASLLLGMTGMIMFACRDKGNLTDSRDLPDLNEQIRPYVTTENTTLRTGPGPQFRSIAQIPAKAKIHVVGKDGDWVLIVSKKGNAPGFVELASVAPGEGEDREESPARASGRYEALTDLQVRSGPGLHYPVVANVSRGTKLNVVDEESGWLKVESKRGNKPGYVDANLAKLEQGQ